MVLFTNVKLDSNQQVRTTLMTLLGIGRTTADRVCNQYGLAHGVRISDLEEGEFLEISRFILKNYRIGNEIKRHARFVRDQELNMKSYKGFRFLYGLPAHGQRTRTNGRTAKKKIF